MHVEIKVDQLQCIKTTDVSDPTLFGLGSNDRDEVYFVVAGASTRGKISKPRVSPPPPEDYYGLKANGVAKNISLWQGDLADGEEVFLTILIREQDNAQLNSIQNSVIGAVMVIAGVFSENAELTAAGLKKLEEAGKGLVTSLSTDGDQTIGAFSVHIKAQNGLMVQWAAIPNVATQVVAQHGLSATLKMTGAKANYTLSASLPDAPKHFVGVYRTGTGGYAFYSSDTDNFIANWKQATAQGLRLVDIDTSLSDGTRFLTGVYRAGTDGHYLWIGVPWDQFVAKWQELSKQGLRLISMASYVENGVPLFIGAYRAGTDGYALLTGDWEHFTAEWQRASKEGMRLVNLTTYKVGKQARQYVGVYRAGTDAYALYAAEWSNFTAEWDKLSKQGLRLIDVETFDDGNKIMYVGVFRAGTDTYGLYDSDWNGFIANWKQASQQGLRLAAVSSYTAG